MSTTPRYTDTQSELHIEHPVHYGSTGLHTPRNAAYWSPGYRVSYEHYKPSDGSYDSWNSFQHYTRNVGIGSGQVACVPIDGCYNQSLVMDTISMRGAFTTYRGQFGPSDYPTNGLSLFYVPSASGSFVPPPASYNDLKRLALNAMLPTIKGQLSLVNSIIELKDFASLKGRVRSLRNINASISRYVKYWKVSKGMTLRQLVRLGAGDYLQAKFNIMPLISDICGVYRAVSQTHARINKHVQRSGRTRTCHFTHVFEEFKPYVFDVSSPASLQYVFMTDPVTGAVTEGGWRVWATSAIERHVWTEPTIFHAEIEYNYNYTRYQLEHARVLSLLDALGLNINPAIIWNALPWSFVVDWVINVSRWLDDQKLGNMEPMINIQRFLWSVKRRRRIGLYSLVDSTYKYGDSSKRAPQRIAHPIIEETAYNRTVGGLDGNSLTTSGLNSNEFSLGAALVLVRGKRPRTH